MPFFPDLAIIIVSYNLKKDTIECIESYLTAGASINQIVIVDNGSTDGTIETINQRYADGIHLIRSDHNRGYPYALNIGIPYAVSQGAQWILLSNNDVVVKSDFLHEFHEAVESNPQYALFSPLIFYHEAPEIVWYCGETIIPGTLIGIRRFRRKHLPANTPPILSSDMVHGCVMLVNKRVFEEIGLFDDSELIYGDDADFSWRARQAGFSAAVSTRAQLWHKISLTINPQKPTTRFLRVRNTVLFYRRYSKGLTRIIMIIFTFIRGVVLTVGDIIRDQRNLIKPLWTGWWSGWTDNSSSRR